jgi:hypothetical protein
LEVSALVMEVPGALCVESNPKSLPIEGLGCLKMDLESATFRYLVVENGNFARSVVCREGGHVTLTQRIGFKI